MALSALVSPKYSFYFSWLKLPLFGECEEAFAEICCISDYFQTIVKWD